MYSGDDRLAPVSSFVVEAFDLRARSVSDAVESLCRVAAMA
jgi:hypothetical protein